MRIQTRFFIFVLMCGSTAAMAQPTNTVPLPNNPPVGIGTQLSGGTLNALHIHYDPSKTTLPAILRLSEGDSTGSSAFGVLGLMPAPPATTTFSSLSTGQDLILHENEGDLILTDHWQQSITSGLSGGAIRIATTPDPALLPLPGLTVPLPYTDIERATILSNGNVGIDLPPDSATGLGTPLDQVQIGGGSIAPGGYTSPIPGLTIYGGNRFEGMTKAGGGTIPVDWRGIAFNEYKDHISGYSARFQPMAGSGIGFSDGSGGLVNIGTWPWHTGQSITDFSGGTTLQITGTNGIEFWTDDSVLDGIKYRHLFDCWRKGYTGGLGIRNDSGLFFHHTPVYIGGAGEPNFTYLTSVHPATGDGNTWMLAVDGPALFKEVYVSTGWPDFVFDLNYKLLPLGEVEQFIKTNHHLPGIPSAEEMEKTGVPLGQTEAKMMQKIEELTKYAIQQDKRIERLESEISQLKNQKER